MAAIATLAQLLTARDQPTVLSQMYATASTLGVDIIGVQAEAMFRAMYEMESAAKSREDFLRVQVAQAGFLQTVILANTNQDGSVIAPPNWADLLALGFFNLTRNPAVTTVGQALLTCNNFANAGPVTAMQARFSTPDNVFFRNQLPFNVIPGASVPITLVAEQPGTVSNVPVASITQINTPLGGCTVSNPAGTNGSWITTSGVDIEADLSLTARCLARWGASSYGGARSAYGQWINDAFTTQGLTSSITRWAVDDTNPNGPGSNDIYLGNAAGPAGTTEVNTVNAYLQPLRALGTGPLRVFSAPGVNVPIIASIFGNSNGAALGAATLAALEAVVPLGGILYLSSIYAALSAPSIPGAGPPSGHVEVYSPTSDIILTGFQVPIIIPTLTASA